MTTLSTVPSTNIPQALAAPFPASAIGWKAQTTTKDKARALAVPYIDARDVMDRLDQVLGPASWRDEYQVLPCGAVLCRLHLRLDGEWIAKEDAGGQSDQDDVGDKMKAAFSDALKRAAVKWGIGRYLYSIPKAWVAYDGDRRQLKETPPLPSWALPATTPAKPEPRRTIGDEDAEAIAGLIRDTRSNLPKFLATYKVKAIADLTPEQAGNALELLAKKSRNGQAVAH